MSINGNGSWEENRKKVSSDIARLQTEVADLTKEVSALKEERGKLFGEVDRLNVCAANNTKAIGKNTTRLAVLGVKIAMLSLGGGVGGGIGTVLVKALLK